MGRTSFLRPLLILYILTLSSTNCSAQQLLLQPSQAQTLLRIKDHLGSPAALAAWTNRTDFCTLEPTPTVTVICYEGSVTQLQIDGSTRRKLPGSFSVDSFFTTLVKLPSLKVLRLVSLGLWGPLPGKLARLTSLEILDLTSNFLQGSVPPGMGSLQTLILEGNAFAGELPESLGRLAGLAVLNLKGNAFHGQLPRSTGRLTSLRILVASNNNFSGEVPDLRGLTNLRVLDLGNNALGPQFPDLGGGEKIESIVLKNNKFTYGLPDGVRSYYQLKVLDISKNRFVGPFPLTVLSLPSLAYVDISQNKFTGMLTWDLPCSNELAFANLTSNLLTGNLPNCLISDSKVKSDVVEYGDNCLETGDSSQQPVSFCKNAAIAVGILPRAPHKAGQASKVALALSICAAVVVGSVLLVGAFFLVKNFLEKRSEGMKPQTTFIIENPSTGYTSKMLKDARYITQTMKLGSLGLPAYRTFSLEELEIATRNFDPSTLMGEGSLGHMYRGQLRDGSWVAIRCLKLKKNHSTQYFMPHIEMISKLRHHHLVNALGHCFEYCLDDSSVSRVFLVFEYVSNGSLRSWISESMQQKLTWTQRIAAVTGVAKGIQFLHTGIVPGLFSNNIKITDVLVDQNLVSKISSYNLPLLSENLGKDRLVNFLGGSKQIKGSRAKHQDKLDIYDFGAILLEVISGKTVKSADDVEVLRRQLQASIAADEMSRKSHVDEAISSSCSSESLRTMIEVCCRCLNEDLSERPSIEDVLWNLQFAAQVQDGWRAESQSSEGSPVSPLRSQRASIKAKEKMIE